MTHRVLLADDEPIVRRLTVTLLELAGYQVVDVADGQAALEWLEREEFDVVLSDVVMPQKGGIELLAALREAGKRTPVVLMTGYSDGRSTEQIQQPFVSLHKPFKNQELLDAVEAALSLTP